MKPTIVTKIIIFPSYVRKKRDQNDLALVRLETPLEFKPSTVRGVITTKETKAAALVDF